LKLNSSLTELSLDDWTIEDCVEQVQHLLERNLEQSKALVKFVSDNHSELSKACNGEIDKLTVTDSMPGIYKSLNMIHPYILKMATSTLPGVTLTMDCIKYFRAGNFFKTVCKSFDNQTLGYLPKELIAKITYDLPLPSWKSAESIEEVDILGDNNTDI